MNLDGSYFPDEEPINPSKGWKITKKIFAWIIAGCAILVWVLFFLIIIIRRDDPLLRTVIFSPSAREIYQTEGEAFDVYQIFTQEFMDIEANIQIRMVAYANAAGELEIGVRLSKDALNNNANKELYFTLTDSAGNTYPMVSRIATMRDIQLSERIKFIYRFERISFEGIYFDLEKNIINLDIKSDEERDNIDAGVSYFLNIYNSKNDENPVFSTVVYNNLTYIKEIDYKLPQAKYLK